MTPLVLKHFRIDFRYREKEEMQKKRFVSFLFQTIMNYLMDFGEVWLKLNNWAQLFKALLNSQAP